MYSPISTHSALLLEHIKHVTGSEQTSPEMDLLQQILFPRSHVFLLLKGPEVKRAGTVLFPVDFTQRKRENCDQCYIEDRIQIIENCKFRALHAPPSSSCPLGSHVPLPKMKIDIMPSI